VAAVAGQALIAAVVQARMSSRRLPGKVLRPLAGTPALQYLLERLARCGEVDDVIVATSVEASDDPVAAFCEARGTTVHRGPLEDVAARFGEVVERFGLDAFVRVTGDSPLLDQALVDRGARLFRDGEHEVVTNVFPASTFPSGQSLEVVGAEPFGRALAAMTEPDEREHVTRYVYRHHEDFRIHNFLAEHDDADLDVSLDTEEDAALIEGILQRMDRPHWDYPSAEVTALARAVQGA
jgi:spore coat polysaccharide biosynthesis protein SpsF